MGETRVKAFVCGHPIAHSRSPMIHGYWLREFGIAGSYQAIDVAPADFPAFVRALPESGFAGGNVTIPNKELASELVARRDGAAELIGAVNTLWLEDGKVCGGNTDAYGFAANLDEHAPGWEKSEAATVLGAGGAARAVVFALKERGIKTVRIVNRTPRRAAELAHRFGGMSAHSWEELAELLADTGLLVNTTSLGMEGREAMPVDMPLLPANAIVADIVYVPLRTPLLAAARARNLKTVDGLGMLLHQAVPGFERWFGRCPKVTEELRGQIVADLEKQR
jgi:shikimate dehydrogenase